MPQLWQLYCFWRSLRLRWCRSRPADGGAGREAAANAWWPTVALMLLSLVVLAPLVWMIAVSLMPVGASAPVPAPLWPDRPILFNCGPLALPSRQRTGVAVPEAHGVGQRRHPCDLGVDLGAWKLGDAQRKRDVLRDGQVRIERVRLEHHREPALVWWQIGHVASAYDQAPDVGGSSPAIRRNSPSYTCRSIGRTTTEAPKRLVSRWSDKLVIDLPDETIARSLLDRAPRNHRASDRG